MGGFANEIARATGLGLAVLLAGCGGSPPPPPAPAPAAPVAVTPAPSAATEPARAPVECPEGSSLDPATGSCRATEPIAPRPVAGPAPTDAPAPTAPVEMDPGNGSVNVRCEFQNGWVSVLPVGMYPRDDQFLMQALVGLTEEPAFWGGLPEWRRFKPFAAQRCSGKTESFPYKPGEYFILAGEAGTFASRGEYKNNGFRNKVRVTKDHPVHLHLTRGDLTHTWVCLSCPFVAFVDPDTGWYERPFVVLANRSAPARRGTDRVRARARAAGGVLRLRVTEVDRETSHLDQLVLEVGGRTLLPRGGSSSALAAADGSEVVFERGTQVVVEYEAPGLGDGWVDVDVIAHGHYEPWSS